MIADFEEGGTQDVTNNGLGLNGVWYEVGSSGTSPAPPANLTPTTGSSCDSSTNFAEVSGTTGSAAPVYASLQGDFVDVSNNPAAYNITSSAPAGTNAFVFCIKGSASGGQVFFSVSDAATTASSDNAGVYVPITASWQSVTVCFNHMQSQGWGVPGHMFDPTTAISYSWKVTAASTAFDIAVDNFKFAAIPAGSCPTFSPTPTPNPLILDDFESTGGAPNDSTNIYLLQDQAGTYRDGSWFSYTDAGSSAATNFSAAGNTGTGAEFSGTLSAQASYAGYGFNFTNPTGTYNAGVSYYDATVAGRYTGISFYGKVANMSTTNCSGTQVVLVDFVDIVGGVTTDHKIAVPFTTSWQQFTVYFNQVLSSTGTALQPVSMYQVQFQPQSNGVLNYTYDFVVDDIQLATGGPGTAATPVPTNVVDNMINGSNQIQFSTGGTVPGYWYDYIGPSSTMCPFNQAFFMASPGHTAQVVQGIPSMAVHYSGSQADYSGVGFWFQNGNLYTDISAYTQLVLWAKSSLPGTYTITFNDSTTNSCYGASVNTSSMAVGSSWAAVTLTYNSSNGSYQFGQVSGTSGTNGCAGAASFSNHSLDTTQAANIQFQPGSGNYDLWMDDLYLQ